MNDTQLAHLHAEYNRAASRAAALADAIRAEVLTRRATVTLNGVTAKYAAGRIEYDHERAARAANAPEALVAQHTKAKISVSWAKVTEEMGLDMQGYVKPGRPATVKITVDTPLAEAPAREEMSFGDLEMTDGANATLPDYVPGAPLAYNDADEFTAATSAIPF